MNTRLVHRPDPVDLATKDVPLTPYQASVSTCAKQEMRETKIKLPSRQEEMVLSMFHMGSDEDARATMAYLNSKKHIMMPGRPDGSCMMSSILHCTLAPYEYTTQSLRRQVVMFVAQNADDFFRLMSNAIANLCCVGAPDTPSPFSFVEYLKYLLNDRLWGDQFFLYFMSCIWQVRVTIIQTPDYNKLGSDTQATGGMQTCACFMWQAIITMQQVLAGKPLFPTSVPLESGPAKLAVSRCATGEHSASNFSAATQPLGTATQCFSTAKLRRCLLQV